MGKWQFKVVSDEEFLAAQRRARIPEEGIKWLDSMAPKIIRADFVKSRLVSGKINAQEGIKELVSRGMSRDDASGIVNGWLGE